MTSSHARHHHPARPVPSGQTRWAQGGAAARRSRRFNARPTALSSRRSHAPSAGNACWNQGEFATINELAEREGIAPSYMTRVLRLTLLAPDIVEAILNGQQGPEVTLGRLLKGFSIEWASQYEISCWPLKVAPEAAGRAAWSIPSR
ncbi:hypothetical protein ACFOHS_22125 [Jhaorihella thermophila]